MKFDGLGNNNMDKRYDVRYMSDAVGELLGSNMSLADAQALVRVNADDMHPENAADLIIREVKDYRGLGQQ